MKPRIKPSSDSRYTLVCVDGWWASVPQSIRGLSSIWTLLVARLARKAAHEKADDHKYPHYYTDG